MVPKKGAGAPTTGKEDRGEWRCFPERPTWSSGGIISGVDFLEEWASHSPNPEPVPSQGRSAFRK